MARYLVRPVVAPGLVRRRKRVTVPAGRCGQFLCLAPEAATGRHAVDKQPILSCDGRGHRAGCDHWHQGRAGEGVAIGGPAFVSQGRTPGDNPKTVGFLYRARSQL